MTSASQIRVTSLSIVFSPSEPSLYTYSLPETDVQICRDGVLDMRGLKLTSKLAVMACIDMRGLKLTSKLAVMACWEPETDVQTLHSP